MALFSRRHDVPRGDPSTQVKISGRGGKLPGTYQVDADLAPFAELSTARGRLVLPIVIRQGGPRPEPLTMDRWPAPCSPMFSRVAHDTVGAAVMGPH